MFKEMQLPKVGEVWSNNFYEAVIVDIWKCKSESSNREFYVIVAEQANIPIYMDVLMFIQYFKLVKEVEEFPEKEFELSQNKLRLERLFSTN